MNNHCYKAYPASEELFARIEYVMKFALQHFLQLASYMLQWKKSGEKEIADKIAHEFALFVFLTSRIADKPATLNKLVAASLQAISRFVRTDANYTAILNNPQQLSRFGQVHIFLTLAGNTDAQWDMLVMNMLDKGYGANSERIVTRLFDKNWQHYILHNEHLFDMDEMIKYSIINTRCHPVYMSFNKMYAYTHTLMYIADFGKTAIASNTNNTGLKDTIHAALLLQMAEQNYDLLGELLINYTYTADSWDVAAYLSWKYFTATWDSLGFLPGVAFDKHLYAALNTEEKSAYAFKEVYHTNLVAGILCANLLEAKTRAAQVNITYPQVFHLSKKALKKALLSAQLFYNIAPEIHVENNINPEILCRQIIELTGSTTSPHWLSLLLQSELTAAHKNSLLVELKMMLCIKKQHVEWLIESIHQYMVLDIPVTQTFAEAVECICNRQLASGAFLLPEQYVSSALSVLYTVQKKLDCLQDCLQ